MKQILASIDRRLETAASPIISPGEARRQFVAIMKLIDAQAAGEEWYQSVMPMHSVQNDRATLQKAYQGFAKRGNEKAMNLVAKAYGLLIIAKLYSPF